MDLKLELKILLQTEFSKSRNYSGSVEVSVRDAACTGISIKTGSGIQKLMGDRQMHRTVIS
jgi:hypothetical protein